MTTPRPDWLSLTTEEALDPDLPICDPHHHFWDRPGNRYMLDELLEDTGGGHNITETVFVECSAMYRSVGPECMSPVGETEFVNGLAAQSASGKYGNTNVAAGIVGYANLQLGSQIGEALEAHIAASPNRFRGIRNSSCWDASPDIGGYKSPPKGLLGDPTFRRGYAELDRLNLSFDAWLYHTQLGELTDLARAFPNVTIIMDHIAGPMGIGPYAGEQNEVFEAWKQGMSELATCENVFIKLGGFGMPLDGYAWHERNAPPSSEEIATTMAPYYDHCIESFGADHCMFESNFPVDKASTSYTILWNVFKRVATNYSASEKAFLFRDSARRAYRI
ncbi:MAG TPA: amidohydrolase [Dehalococcoidia bacterium]|jgi:predicted TIM-barrel fold metal-dependent hydrolase|nr:amidohydrolase [Dehalococcoidia bacterium]